MGEGRGDNPRYFRSDRKSRTGLSCTLITLTSVAPPNLDPRSEQVSYTLQLGDASSQTVDKRGWQFLDYFYVNSSGVKASEKNSSTLAFEDSSYSSASHYASLSKGVQPDESERRTKLL